jgi:MraZ protein
MLLTGSYHRSLDEKLRIAIPKGIRQAYQGDAMGIVYVAPGTDGSLALYPEAAFGRLAGQIAEASPTEADVRAFARLFYAQAQRVQADRQGRIRIPAELAQLAGIQREVVLLGVGDHMELWDEQSWSAYRDEKQVHYDEIAEKALKPTK